MNLVTLLSDRAARHPDRVALIDAPAGRWRATTYQQLEQASQRLAAYLHQQGLQPGAIVLLWPPFTADLYVAIAALLSLGLIGLVAKPGRDLAAQLNRYPPQAWICRPGARALRWRYPALRQIPCQLTVGPGWPGAIASPGCRAKAAPRFAAQADTLAFITFTSGSTGPPKDCRRSHGLLWAQYQALEPVLQFPEGALEATALPLFVLPNLAAGLTVLLPPVNLAAPARSDPQRVLAALQDHRASRLLAAPGLLQVLATWALDHGRSLPHLRQIFLGGAPVLPSLLAQWQQIAPTATLTAVYGATEAEPIASLRHDQISPADLARVQAGGGLPAGQPVAAIQLRLLPPPPAMTPVPAGQPGEIAVRGPHVLGREGGWHRTGDVGYLDAQGRLWLLGPWQGRVGELYPLAVEAIANNYPGVRRSALVSGPEGPVLLVERAGPVRWAALAQALAPLGAIRLQGCRRLPVDRRHNAKLDYGALARRTHRRC